MSEIVDLGFAEACEPWQVQSRMFPSKTGGKPAWLDFEQLPTVEDLQCNICKKQLIFLCQVYASYEDDDNNFHRTIFVFICRSSGCVEKNSNLSMKVLRSNLPRVNKYYSCKPPEEQPDVSFTLPKNVSLCTVCGCLGTKRCSKCQKAVYCVREHQITDWHEGHNNNCRDGDGVLSKILFAERELTMEPEEFQCKQVVESEELEKLKQLQLNGDAGSMQDTPDLQLQEFSAISEDKVFMQFQDRIRPYPDQVLRYERGGIPLWIAKLPRPETIPNCEHCGGARQFEFQIMPQLLLFLDAKELDWGILAVYTCKKSCGSGGYKKEFVFSQNCSNDENL